MKHGTLTIVTLAALIGLNSHPKVSQSRQPLSSHSTATSSDRGIVAANTRKKSSPPSSGSCKTPQGTIQNCWRGVVWEAVPNSYSEFAGGYAYVGKNTIVRKGNLINFDFYGDRLPVGEFSEARSHLQLLLCCATVNTMQQIALRNK